MATVLDTTPGWADVGPDPDRDYHRIRVHALMVVGHGEGDRWLDASVRWHAPAVDTLFIYVDGPVDDMTSRVLLHLADQPTVVVHHRQLDAPSFMEHEARFRASAWATFEDLVRPVDGDWVFVPDADEFLVPRQRALTLGDVLRGSAGFAVAHGLDQVGVPIPEVFGFAPDGTPLVRVDGRWAGNVGPRLVRWTSDLSAGDPVAWRDRPMGCGSVPARLSEPGVTMSPCFGQLLHYGYAHPDDVAAKARRYQGMADHGHHSDHIASITRPPRLEAVRHVGRYPTVWRGMRTHPHPGTA